MIVFLATINHGTYLPFSRRALHFLGPNRQSCSRAQPNHPEIGSVTSIFGSTAFSMCIWSLLPPSCPNPSSIILSPVHHLLLEASSEPWKLLMARDRTRVGKFQGLGPCSSAHVDCQFWAQRGILGETERNWPLGAAHRVTRGVLVLHISSCHSALDYCQHPGHLLLFLPGSINFPWLLVGSVLEGVCPLRNAAACGLH